MAETGLDQIQTLQWRSCRRHRWHHVLLPVNHSAGLGGTRRWRRRRRRRPKQTNIKANMHDRFLLQPTKSGHAHSVLAYLSHRSDRVQAEHNEVLTSPSHVADVEELSVCCTSMSGDCRCTQHSSSHSQVLWTSAANKTRHSYLAKLASFYWTTFT